MSSMQEGSLLGQSRLLCPKPAHRGQACLLAGAVHSRAMCPGCPQRWQVVVSRKSSSKYLPGTQNGGSTVVGTC